MPLTLLYVEDCQKTREVMSLIFKEYFKEVIIAINGKDGLNKFKNNQIDMLITDIEMPVLSGIDMIKKIRDMKHDVSILVISAHNDVKYLTQSIKCQIEDYIFKPIQRATLQNTLTKVQQKIVEKKKKQKQLQLLEEYKEITDESSIISKTNSKGIITYVNDNFCRVSGYRRDELIGENHNVIKSSDEASTIFQELWTTINNKQIWQGAIKNRAKNGDLYYVKTTILPILNNDGDIEEFIASRILINNIIHPKQQLYDFIKSMHESIVIFIKIEDFKYISGYYENNLKEKIQKDINSAKINMNYIDYDLSIIVSFSYGKNALKDAKLGLEQLLETKQCFILANGLSKEFKDKSLSKMQTLKMIKKAIDSYNIVSYFQPIINNRTKQIEKYESLVRLIDEKGNILSPNFFLNVSKEGNYHSKITSIVLENSFKALKQTSVSIAINLSVLDIEKREIREKFLSLLQENQSDTQRIVLELTEEENIKNFKNIKEFIKKIKYLGVKIAIDDFGVGYSGFERVLDYKPDILKIDGRLIKNINKDKVTYSIVEAIVFFAKKEQLKTIAEYVENKAIYTTLCKLGIDYSQGYYFGKPKIL
jgi:PAS domain S-box-containing protein